MHSPDRKIYRFENVEVDLSRGVVLRDGQERHLRQQAFQVLVYLLERGDQLVSKDALFEAVWKNTAVTDDVLVQCVKEIRRVLGDDPHRPRFVKTVPKAGYRFIGEIEGSSHETEEITRVEFEYEEVSDANHTATSTRPRGLLGMSTANRYVLALPVLLVAAVIAIGYIVWPSNSQTAEVRLPQIEGRKTVAVMFFENQSRDTELDWLREGLADMLITDLSRSKNLTVLSRQQLHVLMERAGYQPEESLRLEPALDIARRSHAEVILLGSFAGVERQVRIDGQLHDARSGQLIAAERILAGDPGEILGQVGLLSLKLVAHLGGSQRGGQDPALSDVMTDNLEAYRYYSLGVAKAHALENREAIAFLEKAVELDPDFAMAHARIGYAYAVTWGFVQEGKPHLEKAFRLSSRTTEKDRMNIVAWYAIANLDFAAAIDAYREVVRRFPLEIEAYWRLGRLLFGEERHDEAYQVLTQGIAVDPESKNLYNTLGVLLSNQGKHSQAISAHERYVSLAPAEPNAHDSLGLSYQWAGNYDAAIASFDRALELNPQFGIARLHRANCHIRLGQYRSALDTVSEYAVNSPVQSEKVRALELVSYVHLRKGDLGAAQKAADEIIALAPEMGWPAYLVAVRRGQTTRAAQLGDAAVSKWNATDRGARGNLRFIAYYRGTIALNAGRGEEALAHFRKALTHRPIVWSHVDYEDCLGQALLQLGRHDEAIAEFQRILELSPNYPLVQYHIAQAYAAKGMTAEARTAYAAFLDAWKDADADIPEVVTARNALGGWPAPAALGRLISLLKRLSSSSW